MLRQFSYILALLIFIACNQVQPIIRPKHEATREEFNIQEINYGTFFIETIEREAEINPPEDYQLFGEAYKHDEIDRDKLVAKLGLTFGVEYQINCETDDSIPVNVRWTYPPGMKDHKGKPLEYDDLHYNRPTNSPTVDCFIIETENELVAGDWKMQIFFENELVYEKVFTLF